MTEWLDTEEKLEENDTDRPDIDLLSDLWVFGLVKAFWSLVPVSADTLACQLDFVLIFLDDFAQTEISDFHLTIVENDVLRLQIVVNNLLFLVVKVL